MHEGVEVVQLLGSLIDLARVVLPVLIRERTPDKVLQLLVLSELDVVHGAS